MGDKATRKNGRTEARGAPRRISIWVPAQPELLDGDRPVRRVELVGGHPFGRVEVRVPLHLVLSVPRPLAPVGRKPLKLPRESTWKEAKRAFQRQFIQARLDAYGGSVPLAAKSLGMSRNVLWNVMRRLRRTGGSEFRVRRSWVRPGRPIEVAWIDGTMDAIVEATRRRLLVSRLQRYDGDSQRTAKSLGMSKSNFHRYLAAYNMRKQRAGSTPRGRR